MKRLIAALMASIPTQECNIGVLVAAIRRARQANQRVRLVMSGDVGGTGAADAGQGGDGTPPGEARPAAGREARTQTRPGPTVTRLKPRPSPAPVRWR